MADETKTDNIDGDDMPPEQTEFVLGDTNTFVKVNTLTQEIEVHAGSGATEVRARFNGYTGTAWIQADSIRLDSPNPVVIPNGISE